VSQLGLSAQTYLGNAMGDASIVPIVHNLYAIKADVDAQQTRRFNLSRQAMSNTSNPTPSPSPSMPE